MELFIRAKIRATIGMETSSINVRYVAAGSWLHHGLHFNKVVDYAVEAIKQVRPPPRFLPIASSAGLCHRKKWWHDCYRAT
jgi:hypothetical protein